MTDTTLAKLAREIVKNIRNYKEIFADYGIDENDYYAIEKNEFFQKIKEQFAIEWKSADSTNKRLQIESQAYLEQLLPIVTRRAMREDTNLQTSIDHVKALAKISGLGETAGAEKPGAERFVISINLGADIEHYDKPVAIGVDEFEKSGGSNGTSNSESPQSNSELTIRVAGPGQGTGGKGRGLISDS